MANPVAPGQVIDVSLIPFPQAIKDVAFDGILDARRAAVRAEFEAVGQPYDVEALETDPAILVERVDAYREMLDKAAINDAVRAVLPAHSWGADLDNIVARANVTRLVLAPGDPPAGTAAVLESDAQLLRRYLVAFAAPAAGSQDGYIWRAATAWPQARDILPLGHEFHGERGLVEIVLLAEAGAAIGSGILDRVRAAVNASHARPLTDEVVVRAAPIVHYGVSAKLIIPRGPDPALVMSEARKSLLTTIARRFFIGGFVPADCLTAALYVPNVIDVVPSAPLADVPFATDAAPWCAPGAITLTYEIRG